MLASSPPDPRAVEHITHAGGRQVPVRIITPREGRARAACLEIHGGGFYLGAAARSDARNARLADALGMAVVSVDYRLAPEHPWPAAPDDCETAALWLAEQAEAEFGTTRLMIAGTSAGATLAMTTLLRLRDRDQVEPFAGAVLQFGAYDLSGQSPSGRIYADQWFIQAYAGHVADRTNPDVSPLYGDLRGLPPTLLIVGALDILLEDSLAMAARLSAAGNEVDLRLFPESPPRLYFPSDGYGHGRPGQHRIVACCPAGRAISAWPGLCRRRDWPARYWSGPLLTATRGKATLPNQAAGDRLTGIRPQAGADNSTP